MNMMYKRVICALVVGALHVPGASYAEGPSRIRGLGPEDFASPLTRERIRALSGQVSDERFAIKWQASLHSLMWFQRSYPFAFHHDLAQVPASRIPGEEGLCFGDPHPDNFGFILLSGKTRYVFNDLDDSGYCPIAVDAARYFTLLHAMGLPQPLIRRVLEHYVAVLKDRGRAVSMMRKHHPDWQGLWREQMAKNVIGDRFIYGPTRQEYVHPSEQEIVEMRAAAQTEPRLRRVQILDFTSMNRSAGGSGGMRRYRLLVKEGRRRTILELKQAAPPGVESGRCQRTLPAERRLDLLKQAFWGWRSDDDYVYVHLGGQRFLLRDGLAKKSLHIEELPEEDREHVLRVQVSIMALSHAAALSRVRVDDLRAWLWETSLTLAGRWRGLFETHVGAQARTAP